MVGEWVRGHGTAADVLKGRVTAVNREGNKHSDALAVEARQAHDEWGEIATFTSLLAARQRKYARLVWQILNRNARVFILFNVHLFQLIALLL